MSFGTCPIYIVEMTVVSVAHRQDVVELVTLGAQLDVVDVEVPGAEDLGSEPPDLRLAPPLVPT
jgi:hypothetical protein